MITIEILGINQDATILDIETAWQRKQREYRPSKLRAAGDKSWDFAQAETARINATYETLKDPAKRKEYDRTLASTTIKPTQPIHKPTRATQLEKFMNRQSEVANDRAIECWKQNRFAEAIDLWEQIVRNNPNIAEIFYNLGNAYVYQGKIESAIESLKQAIAVDPTLIEAYNKLGCICYKQGSLDLAFASWNHALKIDPNFEEARHNLRLIQNVTQFDGDNEIPAYQHVTPEEARGNGGSGAEGYDDDKPGWTNRIHRGLRKFRGQ